MHASLFTIVALSAATVFASSIPSANAQEPVQDPVTAQAFVQKAAVIGKAEIEIGQVALKNSADPGVRKFADRMVQDHTAAAAKLKTAADADHVALPTALDAKHAQLKQKLSGLKGDEFDKEYMKAMANGHDEAVVLFQSASRSQTMPADLRQFAAATLPTLEQHQQMAHELHNKEGG